MSVKAPVCVCTFECAPHVKLCVYLRESKDYLCVALSVLAFVCVHVCIYSSLHYVSWRKSPHIVYNVYECSHRVVFAQKLRKATRRLTWQLSIPSTFPFKWVSNAVVYNFNQSVNSVTGFSRGSLIDKV